MAPYYLYRLTPLHDYQVAELRPDGLPTAIGDIVMLPDTVQFYAQAIAERDRKNGKQGAEQGALPI